MGRGPEKTSFQKRHRDANRHMERSSILFIIREMQFKTMMKCHLTLVRMSIIKKTSNNKCGQECEERGTVIHFWWECRLCSPLWKTVWRYLKKRCGFHFPLPASVRLSPPWLQKDPAFLNAHCYREALLLSGQIHVNHGCTHAPAYYCKAPISVSCGRSSQSTPSRSFPTCHTGHKGMNSCILSPPLVRSVALQAVN